MHFLFMSENLVLLESFLLAFMITYISIPSLIDVVHEKKLYDVPNGRTSHEKITPTLGGLAIFAGFMISSMIFVHVAQIPYIQYIMAGAIIIFFIGLKDDITGLSPLKKFIGQIIAAGIIIDMGDIRITHLYGIGGIDTLSYVSSDFLSLFVVVAIINAVNLIDGVDGLASGVGILASLAFGIWFYLVGQYQLAIVSFALVGALMAFFRYNFFSKSQKIFMGDIGSLLLGFMLAIFTLKFIEINAGLQRTNPYFINAAPAVAVGILIIPVFDTIRVMLIRMAKGLSPFQADKRHVHHYLLELTGSHQKTTMIILVVNIVFIALSYFCAFMSVYQLGLILFILAGSLSFIPYYLLKQRRKNHIVSHFKADTE